MSSSSIMKTRPLLLQASPAALSLTAWRYLYSRTNSLIDWWLVEVQRGPPCPTRCLWHHRCIPIQLVLRPIATWFRSDLRSSARQQHWVVRNDRTNRGSVVPPSVAAPRGTEEDRPKRMQLGRYAV